MRYFEERLCFSRINENLGRFSLTMGYEAHLSDFLKVFGDPFSYVTVVKWTLENEKVFVVVKCNYVTVGLSAEFFDVVEIIAGSCVGNDPWLEKGAFTVLTFPFALLLHLHCCVA